VERVDGDRYGTRSRRPTTNSPTTPRPSRSGRGVGSVVGRGVVESAADSASKDCNSQAADEIIHGEGGSVNRAPPSPGYEPSGVCALQVVCLVDMAGWSAGQSLYPTLLSGNTNHYRFPTEGSRTTQGTGSVSCSQVRIQPLSRHSAASSSFRSAVRSPTRRGLGRYGRQEGWLLQGRASMVLRIQGASPSHWSRP